MKGRDVMRCPKCGAEWTLAMEQMVSKFCPNCGQPLPDPSAAPVTLESALQYIADSADEPIFRDGNRSLARFDDVAPQLRKERNLLFIFVQCQGNTLLLDAVDQSKEEQVRAWETIVHRMEDFWLPADPIQLICTAFWKVVSGEEPPVSSSAAAVTVDAPSVSPQPAIDKVVIGCVNTRTDVTTLERTIWTLEDSPEDMRALSRCTLLEDLELRVRADISFAPLARLTNLKRLKLSGIGIKNLISLDELSRLPNLTTLDLSWCENLTDITSLRNLSNLTSLNLSCCENLSDIAPLSGLSNLTSLDLSQCIRLTDITPLSSLSNLKSLDLSGCEGITDITSLSRLSNLKSLDLRHCEGITDIVPLWRLSNLTSLDLTNCFSITDIAPLSCLSNLTELDLSGCDITDITPLSCLSNLTVLDLSYCGRCRCLTDIAPLSRLSNLTELDLRECKKLSDVQINQLRAALPHCVITR